jgi:hypothetical protein
MFIKNLICNYNALELLLWNASRLIFALDAWVALILIMEVIVLLLIAKKENMIEKISTHCFGYTWLHFHLLNQQLWYNSSSFLAPFLHKNPPLNIDLPIILILLISYNIIFGPSHPHRIDYRVWRSHKNKITNRQVTKNHVCNCSKKGACF